MQAPMSQNVKKVHVLKIFLWVPMNTVGTFLFVFWKQYVSLFVPVAAILSLLLTSDRKSHVKLPWVSAGLHWHPFIVQLFFHFRSEDGKPLGEVTEIEMWRTDSGLASDWFCDVIILMDFDSGIMTSWLWSVEEHVATLFNSWRFPARTFIGYLGNTTLCPYGP